MSTATAQRSAIPAVSATASPRPGVGRLDAVLGARSRNAPARPIGAIRAGVSVRGFVEACSTMFTAALDDMSDPAMVPWITSDADAVLRAYLLYIVCERTPAEERDPEAFERFYGRVSAEVWELLGFESAPARLELGLAFAGLADTDGMPEQLRLVIWILAELAAGDLLKVRA